MSNGDSGTSGDGAGRGDGIMTARQQNIQPPRTDTAIHTHPMDNGSGGHGGVPQSGGDMVPDARSLKARIFASKNKQLKTKLVDFFGEQIEIRQASLARVLKLGEDEDDGDAKTTALFVLLNYAYVPGTELPLFDLSDIEQLKTMPYGEDFTRCIEAWMEISGVKVEEAEKNSGTTLTGSR